MKTHPSSSPQWTDNVLQECNHTSNPTGPSVCPSFTCDNVGRSMLRWFFFVNFSPWEENSVHLNLNSSVHHFITSSRDYSVPDLIYRQVSVYLLRLSPWTNPGPSGPRVQTHTLRPTLKNSLFYDSSEKQTQSCDTTQTISEIYVFMCRHRIIIIKVKH